MAATSFSNPAVAAFRQQVRDWIEQKVAPYRLEAGMSEAERIKIRRAWEKELFHAGYNCLGWPVEFGGKGLGPIEDYVFAEEWVAANAPEPLGRIGRLLAAPALMMHGTKEQQRRFLPAILQCDEIWCQGFSEPNAGSDLASLRTTAKRDGDRYLINGQKIWTTFGHYADRCLLLARTGEAGGRHRGLTMFAVPMHQPGVQPRPIKQISGDADFNEVFYDNAEVPLDCVIGEVNDGWRVALTVLTAERGAGFLPVKLRKVKDALDTLATMAAKRPELIPGVRQLNTRYALIHWQILRAIERMASDRDPEPSAAILKVIFSEFDQDLVRFGFEADEPAYREQWRYLELSTRSFTIASGTSEINRNIIAERVLGLPR